MMQARKSQVSTKSRIAIKKGSTLRNKENLPINVIKKTDGKLTSGSIVSKKNEGLTSRRKEATSKHVKAAPDFEKLHKKWQTKLAKGKAVTKRANTKIEPFKLKNEVALNQKDKNEDLIYLEKTENIEEKFSIESKDEITTDSNICDGSIKSKQAFSSPPPETPDVFKIPKATGKTFGVPSTGTSSVKRKAIRFEKDFFEFKVDDNALRSILNNDNNIPTPCKRNSRISSSVQKRASIYYTGSRPDRPLNDFEKRLSMRRAAAQMAKIKEQEDSYKPCKTIIGVQDIDNRFTVNCTPLQEDKKETVESPDSVENREIVHDVGEISWAEKLKNYSQTQGGVSPVVEEEEEIQQNEEDTKAMIAKLEEEVKHTLSNLTVNISSFMATNLHSQLPTEPETGADVSSHTSIPLGQRQKKPSIYRKLFLSPAASASNFGPRKTQSSYLSSDCSHITYDRDSENVKPLDSLVVDKPSKLPEERLYHSTTNFAPSIGNLSTMPLPTCTFNDESYLVQSLSLVDQFDCTPRDCLFSSINKDSIMSSFESTQSDNNVYVKSSELFPRIMTPQTQVENVPSSCKTGYDVSSIKRYDVVDQVDTVNIVKGIPVTDARNGRNPPSFPGELIVSGNINKKYDHLAAANSSLTKKLKTAALARQPSAFATVQNLYVQKVNQPAFIANNQQEILVPTPLRPKVGKNPFETGHFMLRHREIMREALAKSRDHAQEVLLDSEVAMCVRNIELMRNQYCNDQRLLNPIARLFNEGDEMHFVPIVA
ncbi:uncharacterized protein LOC124440760 [Xenia sp. Carnegie-2017]|uniref:uncharacterized protein LOC124440760 n=1 Tax=Xenia sp. Carnegie-2017 TaxID=2897299 RepID=UPI001F0361A5|nr:uncharacterized protein LOC124440760 [Xenia sp. Carnegie-2017]